MNNDNFQQSNFQQDRKFKKQVSHLSGFIGMPMWNGRNPTLSEIREYDRRILEQQAMKFESEGVEMLESPSSELPGFKGKRKNRLNRSLTWVLSIVSKAIGKTDKGGIEVSHKKESVKSSPECC